MPSAAPDILVVTLDDVNRQDLELIPTPNIDALSELEFKRAYAMPLCSQTRKSLMFGRYHVRNAGAWDEVGPDTPDPEWYSLADALKSGGYATGLFGKWHLGAHRPSQFGFDTWRAGRWSNFVPYEGQAQDYFLWHAEEDDGPGDWTNVYAGDYDHQLLSSWWSSIAGCPRFAMLNLAHPHGPLHQPPTQYLPANTPPAQNDRERFEQMVMAADHFVGQLPEADVVVVLGDNGSPSAAGGAKKEVSELGVNVPMRAKGLGVSGVSDRLVHVVDLILTLGRISGAPNPGPEITAELDGRDLVQGPAHDAVFVGAEKDGLSPRYAAIENRWKLTRKGGNEKLWDLLGDPAEQNPLDPSEEPVISGQLRSVIDSHV